MLTLALVPDYTTPNIEDSNIWPGCGNGMEMMVIMAERKRDKNGRRDGRGEKESRDKKRRCEHCSPLRAPSNEGQGGSWQACPCQIRRSSSSRLASHRMC